MENVPNNSLAPGRVDRSPPDRRTDRRAPVPDPLLPGIAKLEAANDRRMSQLARTIEQEIIPRLMLAHRTSPGLEAAGCDATAHVLTLDAGDVERFAKLVLADEEDAALGALDQYRQSGVPIESMYLQLLAPTARFLGDLWDEDLCSFTDVTVGLGRLQRVLRELSSLYGRVVPHPFDGRRALLLPCPGEQHTFGLSMVGEFFRRAGWDVVGDTSGDIGDAGSRVASEWFDVVGFSLSAEIHLSALEDAIRDFRQLACNRDVPILVGGPLFSANPHYADRVGADGMTIDGREAPALAERLIASAAGARAVAQARCSADTAVGIGIGIDISR